MNRASQVRVVLAIALAACIGAPVVAAAGPHGGRHHGGHRASHGTVSHGRATRGHAQRPRVRDHRGSVRPHGHRPYLHHGHVYWPSFYRYGYWPYYGYHGRYGYYDSYYAPSYDGPPGTAEAAPAPTPRLRSRVGLAVHFGQLERDDGAIAGLTGLSLRWRGRVFEGEVELGRRTYAVSDLVERSLGATLYANLGDRDAFHPYLLAGAGVLDSDHMFGAVGAGLALPVASRLTLTGDVRAASIGSRDHHDDWKARDERARTAEGRLTLIVDF